MAIAEDQLSTWSSQGSVAQSAATYRTVRQALQHPDAAYARRSHSIFLQGSYGNDTNVWADSDVDIVMQLTSVYYADTSTLTEADAAEYNRGFLPAEYNWMQFREEVTSHLRSRYGTAVKPGKKAIRIDETAGRRDLDVLVAAEFRRYFSYSGPTSQRFVEGICFWLPDGTRMENYPKQHGANLTAKHGRTSSRFKPTVRIFKNLRNAMIGKGLIDASLAPSYYLEGMLHSVPDRVFAGAHGMAVAGALNWLHGCDRSTLTCANGQFMHFHPSSPMTWRPEHFETYLAATIGYWNAGG